MLFPASDFTLVPVFVPGEHPSKAPFFRQAPDTFNFLRHVMRAILSVRPKCSHRCISLKETPLKPVQIFKHTTKNSAEQTSMRTKWFKHRGKFFTYSWSFLLQLSFFAYSPLRHLLDALSHCKQKSSNCKQKSQNCKQKSSNCKQQS